MVPRKLSDDGVLDRVQILKFVDEDGVPASPHFGRHGLDSEHLRCLENEGVEISDISLGDQLSIAVVELLISVTNRLTAKAPARERIENALVHLCRHLESAQNGSLIRLVGDAEAGLESDLFAEFAQQLGAERMDRPALDAFDAGSELTHEALGDFAGSLVGECEDADPLGLEVELVDKEADPLDEAESFPRSRSCQHQKRLWWTFDGEALRTRGDARNRSGVGAHRRRFRV